MANELSIANPVPQILDGPKLLHELVQREQAVESIAIDHQDYNGSRRSIQYGELQSKASSLALRILGALQNRSLPPTNRLIVPLFIPQCPELYVSQLATLKAGGAFCPIASDVPEERLRFILEDIAAVVLLTTKGFRKKLPSLCGIQILDVDDDDFIQCSHTQTPVTRPSDPAYVLYTSGSTGQPKGVIISHLAATQALLAHDRHVPSFSRFLQFASPTFDVSIFEIFFPLFRGGTTVSCDRRLLLNDLPRVITQLSIDAAELTPSVVSTLLRYRSAAPGLKLLLTIGEMLKQSVIEEFAGDSESDGILYGMYGPTEATIHCTLQTKFRKDMPIRTIGEPLDSVSAFILKVLTDSTLDGEFEILPVGEEGELVVGGHQLADGYLNREDQTKAAFFDHPTYGRLYRTGDLARMLPGGNLECLGRISGGQIKLRGQRIELGEIEYAASQFEGCHGAVADVIHDILVVFCVCPSRSLTPRDVQRACRSWLPEYMVPGDVVILESLPYLSSGKVDRRYLRNQYQQIRQSNLNSVQGSSKRLRTIAGIVSDVLGAHVSMNSDLLCAGIDSLNAIRLASRLAQAGFRQVDAVTLLRAQTIAELAAALEENSPDLAANNVAGLELHRAKDLEQSAAKALAVSGHLDDLEAVYPVTPVQAAMLAETDRYQGAYCNWIEFKLDSGFEADEVEIVLWKLTAHHQLLRSGFVLLPDHSSGYAVVVWKCLSSNQITKVSDFNRTFDLRTEHQLLRPCRFQIAAAGNHIKILMLSHHALYDQWSIDMLRYDMTLLLRRKVVPSPVPFSTVSEYYAKDVEHQLRSGDSLEFWMDQFHDASPMPIRVVPEHKRQRAYHRTEQIVFCTNADETKARLRTLGSSAPVLFQCAVACAIAAHLHNPDMILATVFSGRHVPLQGIERVFGPCLVILPLRVNLTDHKTMIDMLQALYDLNLAVQRHHNISLPALKSALPTSVGTALSDILFIWQESTFSQHLNSTVQEIDTLDRNRFKLVFEFEPNSVGILGRASFDSEAFAIKEIEQLLLTTKKICSLILEHPSELVERLVSKFGLRLDGTASQNNAVSKAARNGYRQHSVGRGRRQSGMRQLSNTQVDQTLWSKDERIVAKALADSLGISADAIGLHTSFFALGLQSLNVVKFKKLLQVHMNRTFAIDTIFQRSNVADLLSPATELNQFSDGNSHISKVNQVFSSDWVSGVTREYQKQGVIVERILPCTPLQEAMLASSQNEPKAYTNISVFKVVASIYRLKECWKLLMERQPILRTSFIETDTPSHPYAQVIINIKDLPWEEPYLRINGSETPNGFHATHAMKDINSFTPWRIEATSFGNRCELALIMHHAIYDGTALAVLLEEVEMLYKAISIPPPPSFEPFLCLILEQNSSRSIEYWRSRFGDFEVQSIPHIERLSDRRMDTVRSEQFLTVSKVYAFCKRHVVTPLSVFQAAWAKTLVALQGSMEVCFGNVVSGRTVPVNDIERLAAPCFNTLPVRVGIDKAITNGGLVQLLHRQNVEAGRHSLVGLRRIQALTQTPSKHLFNSLLLLQPEQRDLDSSIWTLEREETSMDVPIVVEVVPTRGSYEILLQLNQINLDTQEARAIMTVFAASILACVNRPHEDAEYIEDPAGVKIRGLLAMPSDSESFDGVVNGTVFTTQEGARETIQQEEIVREVYALLSGTRIAQIYGHTSLYQLGLDSLNAAQIARRLRTRGIEVDAVDVLEHQTPHEIIIAAQSKSSRHETPHTPGVILFSKQVEISLVNAAGISAEKIEAVRRSTPAQCGMIAQSLRSDGSLYINHVVFRMPHDIGTDDVVRAWKAIQRKHQALRMGFSHTQDNKTPFAILIYNIQHAQVAIGQFANQPREEIYKQAAVNVISELHCPAWRISITREGAEKYMVLSMHHAIYDAQSLQILLADFEAALQSKLLTPGPDIDSELVAILEAAADSEGQGATFWKDTLRTASFPRFPDLSPIVVDRGLLACRNLDCSISPTQFDKYCRTHGVTRQAIGQATWALLLAKYTGQSNVTFGTVFQTRAAAGDEVAVFPCISTIPVVASASQTPHELVKSMVTFNAIAQRHKCFPLSAIQHAVHHGAQALFDTVFVFSKRTTSRTSFSWDLIEDRAAVDYTASLELDEQHDGSYKIRFTFDNGKIPNEQATLMVSQYQHLLVGLLRDDELSLIPCNNLYSIIPPKYKFLPSDVSLLHEFVERSAASTPNRVAFEFLTKDREGFQRRKWTYRQLDERANQVAHLIRWRNIPPGVIIAVCMGKCPEASIAFVGILKAGCAFLAMDPTLPVARIRFILQDSAASLVFVDELSQQAFGDIQTPVSCLDETELGRYPLSSANSSGLNPQTTSYVLYTSGTTGTPKGCEITHENAVQAMLAFQRLFSDHWDSTSRWLQFASYWFDVSVLEHFWSWSTGICVVAASRDLVLDDLAGFIREAAITHIDLTPSLARLLQPDEVPTLHRGVFITGGEALKQEIIDAWGPKGVICNGYGPTEATIGVTMNPFLGSDAKPSNIGPQFLNVGSYVLEAGTEDPVLRGAVGELCVSGPLVGKGYLARPDLTEEHFPKLQKYGERVYRTGDLVRLLANGSFAFIGRKDTQAKLRGQRLDLGEIESVIKISSTNALEVVTLVVETKESGSGMLVAFMGLNASSHCSVHIADASATVIKIIDHAQIACRSRLPAYMVPNHIVPIKSLPLTVNNKLDTKQLRACFQAMTQKDLQKFRANSENSVKSNAATSKVRGVLSEVLGVDEGELSANSNVFSAGLTSVSAIVFANALKKHGFSKASVRVILQNSTIADLARVLDERNPIDLVEDDAIQQVRLNIAVFAQRHRSNAAKRLDLRSNDIEVVVPSTPLQEGMIFDSISNPDRPYFNEFRYSLSRVDLACLRSALAVWVERIQILRTRLLSTDDGYAQVVLRHCKLPLIEIFAKTGHEDVIKEAREQWLADNQHELKQPWRVLFVKDEEDVLLVFQIHHALYDGNSWPAMMQKLAELYFSPASKIDCGPAFTAALPHGPFLQRKDAEAFWSHHLKGAATGRFSHGYGISTLSNLSFSTASIKASGLESVKRRLGVSHQAILQACFEVTLHAHLPGIQIYGCVLSGRSMPFDGAEMVLGPLFNTVPQKFCSTVSKSWETLFQLSSDRITTLLPYQHTPLRNIKKWLGVAPSTSLFDVLFTFQHQHADSVEQSRLWTLRESQPQALYPLAVEVTLQRDGIMIIECIARADIMDTAATNDVIATFEKYIHAATHDPTRLAYESLDIPGAVNASPDKQAPPRQEFSQPKHQFDWTLQAQHVCHAIADIAGVGADQIDENTSIFSLGLDSIDAIKLVSRLKKLGLYISVSSLLKSETIPRILDTAQVCEISTFGKNSTDKLDDMIKRLVRSQPELLNDDLIERVLPATPSQDALLAEMLRSAFSNYFNHDVLALRPDVDKQRLVEALQRVIDCTPILRTRFREVTDPTIDCAFAQVVCQPGEASLGVMQHVSNDKSIQYVLQSTTEQVKRTFSTQPPVRFTMVQTGKSQLLILSMAHALYDGYSLALLHEDIHQAYHGILQRRPGYYDVVNACMEATNEESKQFWSEYLGGASASLFLEQESHINDIMVHRSEHRVAFPTARLRSFCQSQNITLQTFAQTCWTMALAYYTRNLEVVFGVVLACRDSEDAERVMFPTMNTVAMRAMLHGTRHDMLRYMQTMSNEILLYQRTPLRTIKAVVAQSSTTVEPQLFDSIFVYQQRSASTEQDRQQLYESVDGSSSVEYPVAVEMEIVDSDVILRAACKNSVLDAAGTAELLSNLSLVMKSILVSPDGATVKFYGDEVAVCDLPPFHLGTALPGTDPKLMDERAGDDGNDVSEAVLSAIRTVMAQVARVGLDDVHMESSAQDVGIDSISALKVVAILRKQSIELSVSGFLSAKSVVEMARKATSRDENLVNLASSAAKKDFNKLLLEQRLLEVPRQHSIDEANVEAVFPATAGQLYMISLWRKTQGQLFYPTFNFKLFTTATIDDLRRGWEQLVARHGILRTVFCGTENDNFPLVQVVLKQSRNSFYHDEHCGDMPALGQPMLALLAKENADAYVLKLRIHHALYDAFSLSFLMEDFRRIVAGQQIATTLPEYNTFLAPLVSPSATENRRQFYNSYLAEAKPLAMLQQLSTFGSQRRVELFRPALVKGIPELDALARKHGVGLHSLFIAAHAKVYIQAAIRSNRGGETHNVILGVYLANRSHAPDMDRLRAPTLNLVPLLIKTPAARSTVALAKQVQHDLEMIRTAPNFATSLAEIDEWTGVQVDTFVNFQAEEEEKEEEAGSAGQEKARGDDVQTVLEMCNLHTEEYGRVVDADGGNEFQLPSELQGMNVHSAYRHAVDLEAKRSADGETMSVGIFCPEEMLGLQEAEDMVRGVAHSLEKIVGKSKVF